MLTEKSLQSPIKLSDPPPGSQDLKNRAVKEWEEYVQKWLSTYKTMPELAGPYPGDPESNAESIGPPSIARPISLTSYVGDGFRKSLSNSLRKIRSVPNAIEKIAKKYSVLSGTPVHDAANVIGRILQEFESSLGKAKYAPPTTLAEKIAYGVGHVPAMVAEFALLERIVKNPVLSWSIVEAMDEYEHGTGAALKGAMGGAIMGAAFSAGKYIPKARKRAALSGAAGVASTAITEDASVPELVATGAASAVLGAVPQVAGHVPKREPKPPVIMPVKDLGFFAWYLGTPTQWMYARFPEFQYFARAATEANDLRKQAASEAKKTVFEILNRTVRGDKRAWDRVVDYLDDPSYSLTNLPQDTPSVVQAYKEIRELLERYRERVAETLTKMGVDVSQTWGREGYFPHFHSLRSIFAIKYNGKLVHTGPFADSLPEAMQKRQLFLEVANAHRAAHGEELIKDSEVVIEWVRKPQILQMLSTKTNLHWARTLERRMNLPGWRRGPDALMNYIDQAEWFIHMAPVKKMGREILLEVRDRYGPNMVHRFERYLQTFSMPHGEMFARVSAAMLERGWDPKVLTRAIGTLRVVEMMSKLGFSPASAVTNMFQTVTNTLPVLGPKWTAKGIEAYTEYAAFGAHKGILEKLRVIEMDTKAEAGMAMELMNLFAPQTIGEKALKSLAQLAAASMFMFSKVERANRGVAGLGAYLRAKSMGLSDDDALSVARNVIDRTQFNFSRFDSPYILSSDIARTVFQFKTFMVKQIEFMLGMTKSGHLPGRFDDRAKEVGRFLAALSLSAGIVGFPFAENINEVVEMLTGEDLLEGIRREFPRASRGIPGFIGIDMSRRIGYGDWLSIQVSGSTGTTIGKVTSVIRPFVGPGIIDLLMALDVLIQPDGVEKEILWGRFKNQLWPSGVRAIESFVSSMKQKNVIRDYRGYPIVTDVTMKDMFLYAFGFNPMKAQLSREKYWAMKESHLARDNFVRGLLHRFRQHMEEQKYDEAEQVLKEAWEHGFDPSDIVKAWKRTAKLQGLPREEQYYMMRRRRIPPQYVPERFREGEQ